MTKQIDTKELLAEREQDYGNAIIMAQKTIAMFNTLTGHSLKSEDMYWFMMCLKMTRERYKHKDDNLDDLKGYIELFREYQQYKLGEELK